MQILLLPPVVMILTVMAMILLNQYMPLFRVWEAPASWIGLPMVVAGVATAVWHARLFKRIGTNISTFGSPDILTTDGLFRFTRNPMYLGFIVALTGVWIVLGSASSLITLIGFGLLTNYWYIPFEERAMLQEFGEDYAKYKSKVRRWL